jgi:hypothetical protein
MTAKRKKSAWARSGKHRVMLYLDDAEFAAFKEAIPEKQMTAFFSACMTQFTQYVQDSEAEEDHEQLAAYAEFLKRLKEIEVE